jgi:hypothetical protein
MRAGYSAIACGLTTPRALHTWPLQHQQGPHEGSHCTPAGKEPYPSATRTPTLSPATPRTPTPSSASTRTPHTSSTSGRTLRSLSPRTTLPSNPCQDHFRAGYNIYTRREIRLLARPQACRLDRRELTLRRLPRLTSLPGGNTACSSWGAHSYRGGNQRLEPWLSRPASLHDYQRDARALKDSP